jgi:PAS domain S-box-containing protein
LDLRRLTDDGLASHLLAAIVESSSDAVIGKTLDGTVVSWNAAAERIYGYTAEEMVGRSIETLVPERLCDELPAIFEKLRQGERVERYATTRVRKDGREVHVSLTVSPIRDVEGEIVGASSIAHDLSEERRSAEVLHRTEESYRLVFDLHPAPMWVYDTATLRFLTVNAAAIASYGYSREEFLGMTIEDIRPEEDRKELHERLQRQGDEPVAGIWRHRTKDGLLLDVAISANNIEFEGRPARLVLSTDVTRQHRLEEQLRQVQKMEAIGNLAGGIAHDFNNVLTVIRICTASLLDRAADEEDRDELRQLDEASARATEMIRQLLAVSRQQVLRPQPSDLSDLVIGTLNLLERLLGEDVKVVCNLETDLRSVVVDRSQVGQVILNLAINARDAMPDGGTLAIRTANVDLDDAYGGTHAAVVAGRYTMLQITDTGVGMDAETKSRLFEPFFTTKDAGTGLGLATVYGIVRQSNGHVWVYSEQGLGTTFKVYFPSTATAAAQDVPNVEAPRVHHGDATILLVEDDAAVRMLIARTLRSRGYAVLEASSGPAALEIAADPPMAIDVLLTDIVMPGMNGRELAERLITKQPALRVMFTSGYPADAIIRRGITEQRAAFIEKPYLPDELLQKIHELLAAQPESEPK